MGCFSSKIKERSRSFREELSLSVKRRTNGFPGMEGLFKARRGENQVLAVVCSRNSSDKKLESEEHENTTGPQDEPTSPETINVPELMKGLEDGEEEEGEDRERKESILDRKFHTVEEYDVWVSAEKQHQVSPPGRNADPVVPSSAVHEDPPTENGARRKSTAKVSRPLKIQSFEFSGVGGLREWLSAGGQVFSPGSYDTPKFGRSVRTSEGGGGHGRGGSGDLDPELAAELEEAMKDFTREEERIIAQMLERIK